MASKDGVQLGPNVRLPPNYDVEVLPSIPVRVNMSVILFEIVSVNEPKQVQFKTNMILLKVVFLKLFFPYPASAPSARLQNEMA